jgi:hypothetical protein
MNVKTEKEAMKCWCPFANVYVPYNSTGAGGNRALTNAEGMQANAKDAKCLASGCMAWRWAHQVQATDGSWNVNPDRERDGEGTGFSSPERVGRCGLSGDT